MCSTYRKGQWETVSGGCQFVVLSGGILVDRRLNDQYRDPEIESAGNR